MATNVLISIATMNPRAYLRACLKSLPKVCRSLDWSAVVVDNCSSDGSPEMVRWDFPEVELLRNDEARGFGTSHNRVLRRVLDEPDGSRFILVLNDDTVLHPDSVVALARSASATADIGALTPAVVDAAGLRHPTAFPPSHLRGRRSWLRLASYERILAPLRAMQDGSTGVANMTVRGCINYYGRFYPHELSRSLLRIDEYLVRWAMQKFKRLKGRRERAWKFLAGVTSREPELFAHWRLTQASGRMVGAV